MPRACNLAKSLGFKHGKIMPSRAFCSDESQGYPIILIAKHFGSFPFNHGLVGSIVATDRQAPHAHHGRDLVIIQASHVGYEPENRKFGVYRRLQAEAKSETSSCGKICGALDWYLHEYEFARNNIFLIFLCQENGKNLDKIIDVDTFGNPVPESSRSTAKVFHASPAFFDDLEGYEWKADRGEVIGARLHAGLFFYKRKISQHHEGRDHLEKNLIDVMPNVVTSQWLALTAVQANTRVEFDRAFRTIVQEPAYRKKGLVHVGAERGYFTPGRAGVPAGKIHSLGRLCAGREWPSSDLGTGGTVRTIAGAINREP
jgi:hypothetical protein